jgi:hypothetical protein
MEYLLLQSFTEASQRAASPQASPPWLAAFAIWPPIAQFIALDLRVYEEIAKRASTMGGHQASQP